MSDGPGHWLLVVGMHRSGTSGVTGALVGLGFGPPRPDDRLDWPESNPEHWESRALTVHDDLLLERLGGAWDAPPRTPPADGWPTTPGDAGPGTVLADAFEGPGPWVWKDPRNCILLPYWRPYLGDPLAAILIWRDPLAVADSLRRRDGMDLPTGIALWERYNREALANLVGTATFVTSYEHLLADPSTGLASLADWLGALPQFRGLVDGWDVGGAAATMTAADRPVPTIADALLLPAQERLRDGLMARHGGHRSLGPTDVGEESPWTDALIASRQGFRSRELDLLDERYSAELAGAEALTGYWRGHAESMERSTSWRITRPLRSVVAAVRGRGTR